MQGRWPKPIPSEQFITWPQLLSQEYTCDSSWANKSYTWMIFLDLWENKTIFSENISDSSASRDQICQQQKKALLRMKTTQGWSQRFGDILCTFEHWYILSQIYLPAELSIV